MANSVTRPSLSAVMQATCSARYIREASTRLVTKVMSAPLAACAAITSDRSMLQMMSQSDSTRQSSVQWVM